MSDFLRQFLYGALTVGVIATVWIAGWAKASNDAAERSWWPAKDPELARRTFEAALRNPPPADPRHPSHYGPQASLDELMGYD